MLLCQIIQIILNVSTTECSVTVESMLMPVITFLKHSADVAGVCICTAGKRMVNRIKQRRRQGLTTECR